MVKFGVLFLNIFTYELLKMGLKEKPLIIYIEPSAVVEKPHLKVLPIIYLKKNIPLHKYQGSLLPMIFLFSFVSFCFFETRYQSAGTLEEKGRGLGNKRGQRGAASGRQHSQWGERHLAKGKCLSEV